LKRSATSIGADEAFNLGIFANTSIEVLVDSALGPGHGFEVEWPSFNNLYERREEKRREISKSGIVLKRVSRDMWIKKLAAY